jgi:RimJ/RimL family protein N-acetyltransferase
MPLPAIDRIVAPRVELVPVGEPHLEDLLEVNGDLEVTRFLPYATWASLDDARAWLARMTTLSDAGTARQLVLLRPADGKAIGTLLLFQYDEPSRRIELGYALGRAHWHQGLMREAVIAACTHAFEAMSIRRIEAEVNPANAASCALLAGLGFVLEGRLRQRRAAKGAVYDTNLYGLLADDWRRAPPTPA